ncbi:MAG: Clp protease ClpP [Planococcaceae bacterium]|nr:Clp protease ClpP [Planococcaceae bacterium]
MKKINVKGVIIFDDYKEIYDWYGIENTSISDVVNELPTDGSPVEIIINSPGGHVDAGSEIYTHLKAYEGEINTKIYAMAASAASLIAMGGKTSMSPTSQIMIHNVSGVVEGDYRILQKEASVLETYNRAIANAYMLKTGKSQEEILEMMNKETYLTAQEAVELGFADEIMFDTQAPKAASLSASLLPKEAVDKARQMLKAEREKPNPQASPSINNEMTQLKAQMEIFKNELQQLKNTEPEKPTPVKENSARKAFLSI